MTKRHPDLFAPLFVDGGSPPLTPGTCMYIVGYNYTIIPMEEFVFLVFGFMYIHK